MPIVLQEVINTQEALHLAVVHIREELVREAQQGPQHRELQPIIEAAEAELEVAVLTVEALHLEATVIDHQVVAQAQEAAEAIEVQEAVLEVLAALEAQAALQDHLQEVLDLLAEVDLQVEEDSRLQTF